MNGLWSAVILQALLDATSNDLSRKMGRVRQNARRWLLDNDADFNEVCLRAGIDPQSIRFEASEQATAGWRKKQPYGHFQTGAGE